MNTCFRKTTILLLPLMILVNVATAQTSRYEFGISGGLAVYRGDLTPSAFGSYRTASGNFNLFVNRDLNQEFSIRANFSKGKLSGQDAGYDSPEWRKHRNFRFSAGFSELSALLIWNKWGNFKKLSPYLFAGLGLSFTRIERDHSGMDAAYFALDHLQERLAQDLQVDPPSALLVLPVGAGLRYQLTRQLALLAETSLRFTRTDYLDGFSKAANPQLKDHYQTHTLGIVYRLGKGNGEMGCPVW